MASNPAWRRGLQSTCPACRVAELLSLGGITRLHMKSLAKALIQTAAFLELSGEDVVSVDDSVRALEDIAHTLQSASPAELAAVRDALAELAVEERAGLARADVLRFYEHFFESIGVTL